MFRNIVVAIADDIHQRLSGGKFSISLAHKKQKKLSTFRWKKNETITTDFERERLQHLK